MLRLLPKISMTCQKNDEIYARPKEFYRQDFSPLKQQIHPCHIIEGRPSCAVMMNLGKVTYVSVPIVSTT